jgi:hypothetical protein
VLEFDGFGGSRVDLPPLVVTALIFFKEFIFPSFSLGIATAL